MCKAVMILLGLLIVGCSTSGDILVNLSPNDPNWWADRKVYEVNRHDKESAAAFFETFHPGKTVDIYSSEFTNWRTSRCVRQFGKGAVWIGEISTGGLLCARRVTPRMQIREWCNRLRYHGQLFEILFHYPPKFACILKSTP